VSLSEHRTSLMSLGEGAGFAGILLVLIVAGMERLRYAIIGFILLVSCVTYPALQYQYRHMFHLEFAVLLFMASGFALFGRLYRRAVKSSLRSEVARALRSLGTVTSLVCIVVVVITVARAIQVPRVRRLLTDYATAPLEPVSTTRTVESDGHVRLRAEVFKPPLSANEVQTVMLAVELDPNRCQTTRTLGVMFKYEAAAGGDLDLSHETLVSLKPQAKPTRVFLPVHQFIRDGSATSKFLGIDLTPDAAACAQLLRIRDLNTFPALLLPVTLGPQWDDVRLYQRLPLFMSMPPGIWARIAYRWPRVARIG